MRLTPSDPDIQTLINRISSDEIDLQPDFQRGEVWSTAKKQRLVDSILRDWHIPPLHVIVDSESGQQLVLDGQQRLTAIRDFVLGKFSVDGNIEPIDPDLNGHHGKRYDSLRPDLKRRFDQFTIRVFRITDYSPQEPGELFYRLNQPTALTAAEQRNAFFGETRKQIKFLVDVLEAEKINDGFWGFSNARMAYDDILSRAALFFEQNSLRKKVTAGTLADRFRSGNAFDSKVIQMLSEIIKLCGDVNRLIANKPLFNKGAAQSWLIFLSIARSFSGDVITPSVIADFISKFEKDRLSNQSGFIENATQLNSLRSILLRAYEDRSSARVSDALSVQTRDFVIWSCFLLDCPDNIKEIFSKIPRFQDLLMLISNPTLEEWQSVEKLVAAKNWGDSLWQ